MRLQQLFQRLHKALNSVAARKIAVTRHPDWNNKIRNIQVYPLQFGRRIAKNTGQHALCIAFAKHLRE